MRISAAQLAKDVQTRITNLRQSMRPFDKLMSALEAIGEIAIVGGAPRDWVLSRVARDIDIVVAGPGSKIGPAVAGWVQRRTRYGGYRLRVEDLAIDVWALSASWPFADGIFKDITFDRFVQTAFFNFDAVAVRLADSHVFECGFLEALSSGTLEIVFRQNPFLDLCATRALVLAKVYRLKLGESVATFLAEQVLQGGMTWATIEKMQLSHYGKVIVEIEDLKKILPSSLHAMVAGWTAEV